jgi:hypothetical protein
MFILSHMFEEIAANVGGIPGCPEFLPLRFPSTNWGKRADLGDPGWLLLRLLLANGRWSRPAKLSASDILPSHTGIHSGPWIQI